MTSLRWVVSLLIAFHLIALVTAAIPAPAALRPVSAIATTSTNHPPQNAVAAVVTPVLDRAAGIVSRFQPVLFRTLRPVRRLSRPYISAGVGGQQWNMFSSPYTVDQYLRIDYYVTFDGGPRGQRLLRELVLPADHEEHVRGLHQFRDKFVLNTVDGYFAAINRGRRDSDDAVSDEEYARRSFEPIARYFGRRVHRYLASDERLVRTEVWYGVAPIPAAGLRVPTKVHVERLDALNLYHDGPSQVISRAAQTRRRGATDLTADIRWRLEYIHPS